MSPEQKLELAKQISDLMDAYFKEKDMAPDNEVLILTLYARTESWNRGFSLTTKAT